MDFCSRSSAPCDEALAFDIQKTKNKYIFYLNGKGERVYFEMGGKKYLVDNVMEASETDR